MSADPELIESHQEEGRTWQLFRRGEAYEIHVDGKRICATDLPRNEASFVELALGPVKTRDDITVLIAGLGAGRTVRQVLDWPGVQRVDVVEASPLVIQWEKQFFAASNRDALSDPRVHVHKQELGSLIKQIRLGAKGLIPDEGMMVVLLDLDEGPNNLSRPGNAGFYSDEGLEAFEMILRPGGVLALWSSSREPEFMRRFAARFSNVAEVAMVVDLPDGASNLDYVYRGRRQAVAKASGGEAN